jgi:proteasome lid subunit RPN8/RPN11
MAGLIIPRDLLTTVLDHCRRSYPNEACGILAGAGNRVGKVYAMTNIEPSPVSYFMDPGEQFVVEREMRKNSERMVAIYHSHPQSPAFPSLKDISLAFYDDAFYVIVRLGGREAYEMRAFTIRDGRASEVSVSIEP